MKKKIALFTLIAMLVLSMVTVPAKAASSNSLAKSQARELELKMKRTAEVKRNWDKIKPVKEVQYSITAASVGSYGDILVTLDGTSSSLGWAGGHAGLVENSAYVIESFGNKGSSLNGVRRWPNDWGTRYASFKGLRVYNATSTQYSNATSIGVSHLGKPYNYNFFNITTTSSFYCSQLVWRAWYNQGYDLNDGGAVWPVDLIESSLTYAFYSK